VTTGANICPIGAGSTGGYALQVNNAARTITGTKANTSNIYTGTGTVTANTNDILETQYNNTTGVLSEWINGTAAGTGTASVVTFTAQNVALGACAGSADWNAAIAEFIAYDVVGGIPSGSQSSIVANQTAYWGIP